MRILCSAFPSLPEKRGTGYPVFEFHILRDVRKRYDVDESLFSTTGNVILPNYRAVRLLAQKMNAARDLQHHPELTVRAGQLNAMGLIDEIYHYILRVYEDTANPKVFARAVSFLDRTIRPEPAEATLRLFGELFPPIDVYQGKTSVERYLNSSSAGKPHREMTVEEMILLYFANFNPAFTPFKELFDQTDLANGSHYSASIEGLERFFQTEKPFGPEQQFIFNLLRAPILASPNSLEGQLEYIRQRWGMLLSEKFLTRLLGARDLIKEDDRIIQFGPGPAETVVPRFGRYGNASYVDALDIERFTSDLEWMPRVVLLAKNTYVWLDQLSKKYRRSITKLNEIPDEELDQIAAWGFTGLWLIGIWERSPASQKIKQISGNPEAVASAYSVYEYEISRDLGGEDAFQDFRHRAWYRGIRLAGDMVPNHMGIYSRWVMEHPEYFVQSSYRPFPNYQYTGPNLSEHPDIEIRIEDGYWSRRDAAVAFERIDRRSGEARYIYHGNDGTSMPWNDTAQLDFLRAEVREAVVQTIFHVARKFSIIRFDAAMTLTKKHFERLWYPQPGSGGDIPSRADHAMSLEEFNRLFPQEFWREVVDRINTEMPSTLLLAEAFWLLEGYFVRTLGMHRVYNSAFMHMVMKEENAKYREAIKNTLHYNPEILKRYVNFMSNPDEQTAIAQFGKDDKYFGSAVLMVTLPGLPMFAHGQIEGYGEKYGMEYKRAYYNEDPDYHLIRRHEQEIFPLMKKRHLFSQVTNFELYNFIDTHGQVNENVFAYSNRAGDERAIVCYHNKFEETAGWIKYSAGKTTSTSGDENSEKIHTTELAHALGLHGHTAYYIFRDHKSGLEFLRSGHELYERGLYVELRAFQYHIFLDFREVHDVKGEYSRLAHFLNGRGVPDIRQALRDMQLAPVHDRLRALLMPETVEQVTRFVHGKQTQANIDKLEHVIDLYKAFLHEVKEELDLHERSTQLLNEFRNDLTVLQLLAHHRPVKSARGGKPAPTDQEWIEELPLGPEKETSAAREFELLYALLVIRRLGELKEKNVFEHLQLGRIFEEIFLRPGDENGGAREEALLLEILYHHCSLFADTTERFRRNFHKLLDRLEVQRFIRTNIYQDVLYYHKERFEELIRWLFITASIEQVRLKKGDLAKAAGDIDAARNIYQELLHASEYSGYKIELLKQAFSREKSKIPDRVL